MRVRYIRYTNIAGRKSLNPFMQVLVFIGAVIAFGFTVLVGGVVLAALFGFVLIAGVIIYARLWWLRTRFGDRRRRDGKRRPPGGTPPYSRQGDEFVEAEYQVIDKADRDPGDH
jgi:hypothetical protein